MFENCYKTKLAEILRNFYSHNNRPCALNITVYNYSWSSSWSLKQTKFNKILTLEYST